jgi:DNA-binding response OmpR family regulator
VEQGLLAALRLGWAGAEIAQSQSGQQALEHIQNCAPDLIVVDTDVPDIGWIDLLREIRHLSDCVTMVLSRQFSESELMVAVEAGADDYVQVPVSSTLFTARVQAALRRAHRFADGEEGAATYGNLEVDPTRYEARVNGQRLKLTATEFKILLYMTKRGGRVVRNESLRNLVWGEDAEVYGPCLRKYIQHLRRRLEGVPDGKMSIITVPKVGYKLMNGRSDILVGSAQPN